MYCYGIDCAFFGYSKNVETCSNVDLQCVCCDMYCYGIDCAFVGYRKNVGTCSSVDCAVRLL